MLRLAFLFLVIALGAEMLELSDVNYFSLQINWLVFPLFLVLSVLTLVFDGLYEAPRPHA